MHADGAATSARLEPNAIPLDFGHAKSGQALTDMANLRRLSRAGRERRKSPLWILARGAQGHFDGAARPAAPRMIAARRRAAQRWHASSRPRGLVHQRQI